jgi:nucleoside-diphosphate-sugar epimerase
MTRQRILIAGCGYLGQRVARRLLNRGCDVFPLTRCSNRAAAFAAEGMHPVVYSEAALRLPNLPQTDVVLWAVGYDRSNDRNTAWITGFGRLLKSLPFPAPVRICLTSTTGVYGEQNGQDVDEDSKTSPASEGGNAYLDMEAMLHGFCCATKANISVFRLAGIYGPDRLLRRVSELRSGTPISADPDHWLNLIHVDDAANLIDACIAASAPDTALSFDPPPLINVVASRSVTRREYYSTLARLVQAPEPVFSEAAVSEPGRRRSGSGGNRRIVSRVRPVLPVTYAFDDHEVGLEHSVRHSRLP